MDLINGTLDPIKLIHDSTPYQFEPLELADVPEDAGKYFLEKYSHLGISRIRFNDDPDRVKLNCLTRRREHFRRVIAAYENAQRIQKKKEFDPLPDDEAVIQAREQLPFYNEQIERLEKKLGVDRKAEHRKKMETLMAKQDAPRAIEGASLDDLRAEARRLGVKFQINWTRSRLLAAVIEARQTAGSPA